jgi:hypothetical protein
MMVTRPQTIGYALVDSPSGLAAFTYEKIAEWSDTDGHTERVIGRDEILDDITLYWLTNTGASSSRFYWENNNNNFSAAAQKTNQIRVPVAIKVFPHEIYRAPESCHGRLIRRCTSSMKSPRAVTSRRGNSRNSSPRRCERHLDHCARFNKGSLATCKK